MGISASALAKAFQTERDKLVAQGFQMNDWNPRLGYRDAQDYSVYPLDETINDGFGFETRAFEYSCAIPLMGNFYGIENNVSVMVPLIKIAQLVEHRQGYFQAATLDTKEYNNLNEALFACDFHPLAQVRSQQGRYKNIVWEWQR